MAMEVVGVQLDIVWEAPADNQARVREMLQRSRPGAGAMVVLPEMFATGFSMNLDATADDRGRTIDFLAQVAREFQVHLIAGAVSRGQTGRGRNQAVVLDPSGNLTACYTKLHPFSLGGEKDHYEAGSEIVTFRWQRLTVAPFICYDLRFPEIFRLATRRGAEMFVVIANWPISRLEHWITLLRARAIENQAYVLGVNRSGRDPHLLYPGRSILVDPMGLIRADAGDAQGLLHATVDPDLVRLTRERFPFLEDLRDDLAGSK